MPIRRPPLRLHSKEKGAEAPEKVTTAPAAMVPAPMSMTEACHGVEAVGAIVVRPPPAADPRVADPAHLLDVRDLVGMRQRSLSSRADRFIPVAKLLGDSSLEPAAGVSIYPIYGRLRKCPSPFGSPQASETSLHIVRVRQASFAER